MTRNDGARDGGCGMGLATYPRRGIKEGLALQRIVASQWQSGILHGLRRFLDTRSVALPTVAAVVIFAPPVDDDGR